MKKLVLIPCYNEEDNIIKTVENIKKYKYDYIVINDGSTDNTLELLKKNNINYINLINNLGIGGVVQTGYKYAYKHGYDIAIQFDGDGQHDAKYIKNIVEPIEKNKADMVIGSRFVSDNKGFKSSVPRRIGISILSFLYKLITHKVIKDMTSGFRAVNRDVMKKFSKSYPYEYPEPVTNLAVSNKRIIEVPVVMKKRQFGKSSIGPFKSIYYMINVIIYFLIIMISGGDDYRA